MGNSSLRPVLAGDATNFQADLPKFILQSKIGNGKLMKTYLMRCESNSIVVKVYMSYPDEELRTFAAELTRIWYTISPSRFPNLLPYQLWMRSGSRQSKSNVLPIYIIRQYLYSNLHDRMSTRPFLAETEKLWILYQLFRCVETCHNLQIMHGDIKPENILCTTSNWVVLTDFAAFKPVNVPNDNPSDFQYYFDSMNRPRCYVAPERFFNKSRLETKQRGLFGGGEKNNTIAPTTSAAMKRPSVVSTASSLSAFEKSSENALLLDSVFGDAATALRFKNTSTSSSNSEGPNGMRGTTTGKGTGTNIGTTGGIVNGERDDYDELSGDHGDVSCDKLYSVIEAGMDVFSLGCTIAEVILDGEPFLDLSGMLKYANNTVRSIGKTADNRSSAPAPIDSKWRMNHLDHSSSPAKGALDRIWAGTGTGVGKEYLMSKLKQVVVHMTQRDPDKRLSVAEYREQLEGLKKTSVSDVDTSQMNPTNSKSGNSSDNEREAPFPAYFRDVLYPLFLKLHWEGICPDQRISIICESYGALIKSITGESDEEGHLLFFDALKGNCSIYSSRSNSTGSKSRDLNADHSKSDNPNSSTTDASGKSNGKPKIDFSELSTAELLLLCQQSIAEAEIKFAGARIGTKSTGNSTGGSRDNDSGGNSDDNLPIDTSQSTTIPKGGGTSVREALKVSIKNGNGNSQLYFGKSRSPLDQREKSTKQRGKGVIILVQLVTSTFRHLSLPRSKIASTMLLVRLSLFCCDDEVVLKRVLPCLLVALSDPSSPVRAIAIRALTVVITSVHSISSFESNFFQQYLFAPLSAVARDVEIPVRLAFSECLGSLAETARRFLERSHLLALTRAASDTRAAAAALHKRNHSKSNSDGPATSPSAPEVLFTDCHVQFPYDSKVRSLHDQVIRWIRDVSSAPYLSAHTQKGDRDFSKPIHGSLTSSTGSSIVKRALLEDIGRLCIFFGQEATTDLLLTQILTFLNDQDWELRLAFCLKIPTVCAFLGPTVTSECILPFLENALADSEERVVAQSVRCITALVQLRLLSRLMTVDAVKSAAPLLLHPRSTIRSASLSLVDAAAAALGLTDSAVFLLPLLRPALAYNLTGVLLTSETVSKALIEPLSWRAFRRTLGTRQMALIGSLYSPKNAPSRKEGKGNPSQTTIGDKERDAEERLQRDKSKEGNDITQKNMGNSWVVSSSSREINSFEYENDEDDMVDNDYESENDEDLWCEQSTPSSTVQNSGASSPPKKNEINNYVDQDTSGGQTQATMPFEDAAEPLKLQYVSDYIDLAARESLSRATQGHWHGDITGGQVLGNSSFQVRIFESDSEILHSRGESLSLALSQVTQTPSAAATGLSEHLAHSLLVPNQIYDSGSACSIPSSSSATNPATTSTSQRSSPFLSESDRDMAASILFGTDPEKVAKGVSRSALHAIFGVQVGDLRSDVINGFIRRGDPISLLSHTGKRNAIDTSLPYSAPSSSYVDSSGVASYIRSSGHMEEGGLSSVPSASITVKEETGKEADDIVDKMKESDRENDRDRDRERTGAVAPSSLDDTSGQRASTLSLIGWLRALKIPPLPPDLGSLQHSDGTPYSSFTGALSMINSETYSTLSPRSSFQTPWKYIRPPQGQSPPPPLTLMSVLSEHSASVNKLAVSPDQSYFASGSSDCTVKIWQLKGLDKAAFPRSSITYTGHTGGVTDLCVIENTHSIASASQDGQIHVWCVELACSTMKKNLKANEGNVHSTVSPAGQALGSGLSVRGLSVVRTLNPADGSITALKHFTSLMTSVVTYTTQRGSVVGWDLRSTGEAFHYSVRPEFGVSTCMALPPSGSGQGWVIVGTSRGYLLMWDLRFNVMCAAWRHSSNGPIHKISCFRSHSSSNSSNCFPSSGHDDDEEDTYDTVNMDAEVSNSSSLPSLKGLKGRKGHGIGGFSDYLVIAAGLNEMAVWSLPISANGASMRTFRAIPIAKRKDRDNHLDSPHLISVPLPSHPSAPIQSAILSLVSPSHVTKASSEPSIRAFVTYISPDDKSSYLISGGTDSLLRYWNWSTPLKCSVLSGLSAGQQKPSVVSVKACSVSSSSFLRSGSHDGTGSHDMCGDQPTAGHRDYDLRQGQGQSEVRGHRSAEGQYEGQTSDSNDIFVFYDTEPPSRSMKSPSFQQALLPLRDSKGTNQSVCSSEDAILDINGLQSSKRLLISCSRDGLIKLWR